MRININKKYAISLGSIISFFLALSPVLDPYVIAEIGSGFTIRVNDIIVIMLGGLAFIKKRKIFDSYYGFLIYWCLGMACLTLLGLLGTSGTSASIAYKNVFIWTIYAFLVMYMWRFGNRERFFVWAERIALLCGVLVLLQFLFGNLGISVWDGKIPGLSLSKYDGWSGYIDHNTGDIRPCGIFQEASYVGIYLLIVYAYSLKNNRVIKALIYALVMILTTSMVAILGCALVTIYILLCTDKYVVSKKTKRKIFAILGVGMVIAIYLINSNEYVQTIWSYVSRRIFSFSSDLRGSRMGSTKWRLLGNISLFENYNLWQKLVGLGTQQYARYFAVVNYSNNFVNVILNYGLVGLGLFIGAIIKLARAISKNNLVYLLITLIIFLTDQQWYNWFFFYLLTACILQDGCSSLEAV